MAAAGTTADAADAADGEGFAGGEGENGGRSEKPRSIPFFAGFRRQKPDHHRFPTESVISEWNAA